MPVYFDSTPLSPTQTSLLSLAEFNAFAAKRGGLDFATPVLTADGDYQIAVSGVLKTIASSRAAIHGGVEGTWYYLDFSRVFVADVANTAASAITAGRDVVLSQSLNRASMLLSSLSELCGTAPHFRQREFNSSVIAAYSASKQFTAVASDNAFLWVDYSANGKVTFSGFQNAQNNAAFTVVDVDASADPHVLTVAETPVDEVSPAMLSFVYEPGLSIPRDWYPVVLDSSITPRALKDAAGVLAINFLRGDVMGEAGGQADKPVKKVEVYQAVSVEFMQNSAADLRLYLNDEVLQLLSPYLCTAIRGYGILPAIENMIEAGVFDD